MKHNISILTAIGVFVVPFCMCWDVANHYLKAYEEPKKVATNIIRPLFEMKCPGQSDKFDKALREGRACEEKDIPDKNLMPTVCGYVKTTFLRCNRPLMEVFEDCSEAENKGTATFIFNTIESTISYICNASGEKILELTNPCLFAKSEDTVVCRQKIESTIRNFRIHIPTKQEICNISSIYRPCLDSYILKECYNPLTRESVKGFYAALASQCNLDI